MGITKTMQLEAAEAEWLEEERLEDEQHARELAAEEAAEQRAIEEAEENALIDWDEQDDLPLFFIG